MAKQKTPTWVSNWSVAGLLLKLPRFRRVDKGGELLAFRLAGNTPGRTVYVYLYGEDPSAIHFDLEQETPPNQAFDLEPEHGSAWSVGDLALILRWWLTELTEQREAVH